MFHFLVLASCVFACTFGKTIIPKSQVLPKLDGRIVGGESTTIEEFPHQVSLRYFGSHKCGGSIISDRIVISAAHCVDQVTSKEIQIAVGSTSKTKGIQIFSVEKIIKHENYNSQTVENDIAILILSTILEFNDSVQPIELPDQDEKLKDGSQALVSGWGLLSEDELDGPDVLQFVMVNIVNSEKCSKAYRAVGYEITEKMLCAGIENGGHDTCQQDSGGPLISDNNKLIGIVSWGLGCARAGYPGVYARVSAYIDWIHEQTALGLEE